jgi:DUF1680 family protein
MGWIDNFAKAGGLISGELQGRPFDDFDAYKVIEGAAYTLATHPGRQPDVYFDELINKIAAAQEADAYLCGVRQCHLSISPIK